MFILRLISVSLFLPPPQLHIYDISSASWLRFSFFLFLLPFFITVWNGSIKRIQDDTIKSSVIEILGESPASTFISCPNVDRSLGIRLPYIILLIKNIQRYFSFEVQILDSSNISRLLRMSNFVTETHVKDRICHIPLRLEPEWNQIQCNIADFTKRAFGTEYVETLSVKLYCNCRIRRIYFSDRVVSDEDLPPEFKLYAKN